jgi:hypothetical protein
MQRKLVCAPGGTGTGKLGDGDCVHGTSPYDTLPPECMS